VDIALLIGTDFNAGIPQVGPKTALKLVLDHKDLEHLPDEIRGQLPSNYQQLRDLFLHPRVTEDYDLTPKAIDKEGLVAFLCHERGFAEQRVLGVIERLMEVQQRQRQQSLDSWTKR
jgi:flap endonuclease-1